MDERVGLRTVLISYGYSYDPTVWQSCLWSWGSDHGVWAQLSYMCCTCVVMWLYICAKFYSVLTFLSKFHTISNLSRKKLYTAPPSAPPPLAPLCRHNQTSQAGPSCEYTDYGHDVHMTHYATGGGDISWIHVKNA